MNGFREDSMACGPMYGQDRDGEDGGKDAGQHDDDEKCGPPRISRRWLSDAHCVDEGVRDEQKKFHGRESCARINSSRECSL
jgi:hypothetical protein